MSRTLKNLKLWTAAVTNPLIVDRKCTCGKTGEAWESHLFLCEVCWQYHPRCRTKGHTLFRTCPYCIDFLVEQVKKSPKDNPLTKSAQSLMRDCVTIKET